jgi:Glycosyltransferase family 87
MCGWSNPITILQDSLLMHSNAAPAPRLGRAFNDGMLGLFALTILLVAFVFWSARGPNVERTDFALTYAGAHIVHAGMGRQLYDTRLQVQLRDSLFQYPSPLYFEHPPFEALVLSPLAAFSFRTAYTIWGLFNVSVLLGLTIWLRPFLSWPSEDLGYLFFWLLFAPLLVVLYQGQSSVMVLAAFAMAFVELKKGHSLAAGVALGFGLVKFQFVLPLALIFLLRRQWRFVAGFAASAAALGSMSIVAVGWGGILDYMHLLLRIGNNPHNVSYGSAVDMPTLHGLVYAIGGRYLSTTGSNIAVALLSIALLAWIAWFWERTDDTTAFDLMFAAAIAASLLCGSHMFAHDFSPLILAMFLGAAMLRYARWGVRFALTFTLIVFWTFPLYFLFVKWHCLYLMALALLGFTWSCAECAKHTGRPRVHEAQTVAAG